jgi:hypothetical protein
VIRGAEPPLLGPMSFYACNVRDRLCGVSCDIETCLPGPRPDLLADEPVAATS